MIRLLLTTASGPRVVSVEIARSAEDKAKGLAFRSSLPRDHGMLFVYDRPQEVAMWMRGTLIPLDLVFLRERGVVHRIEARATPGRLQLIPSRGPVVAVLELAGGAAEEMGLRVGDHVNVMN